KLNLSIGTVSRSLRDSPEIPPATRQRVQKLASELNYRLPGFNKRPRSERARSVGVLIQSDADVSALPTTMAHYTLPAISNAVREFHATMLVEYVCAQELDSFYQSGRKPPLLKQLERVAGLILLHHFPVEVVRWLSTRITCVTLANHYSGLPVDCISGDDAQGVHAIVGHLHQLGHRRIGFVCKPDHVRFSWLQSRLFGYQQALREFGLPVEASWQINTTGQNLTDDQTFERLIELTSQDVTAWICANDNLGYRVVGALRQAGLRVPEDVSVAGFDHMDVPVTQSPLTTVRSPFAQMGTAAVRRLMYRLKYPDELYARQLLESQLIVGATTGPPVCH
ncbi:MAG: LacI family DNA-binding transcriptional regulator, partial [Phycisphaeraceae bacterium JB051]